MALTSEDLLAISQLLDTKLKPLEDRAKNIELLLENDTLPRLQNIESCYTSTYRRYAMNIPMHRTGDGFYPGLFMPMAAARSKQWQLILVL